MQDDERIHLAEDAKRAGLKAALEAYDDAGTLGLCADGRWEAAISALQRLDVEALAASHAPVTKELP